MALYDDFAIATFRLQRDLATDAMYRTYGQAVHTALAAAGLVQTADTGQVDWATATRINPSYISAQWSIWRFDDALQATSPIFLKFYFGCNTTGRGFGMLFEAGTGSNGTGTLTHRGAPTNPVIQGTVQSTSSSSEGASVASSYVVMPDKSSLFICLSDAFSNVTMGGLLVERFRDTTGAPVDGGAIIVNTSAAAVVSLFTDASPVFASRSSNSSGFACMGGLSPVLPVPWVDGTKVPYYPCGTGNNGMGLGGFSIAGVAVVTGNVADGTVFPATIHGQDVKCLALTKRWNNVNGTQTYTSNAVTFCPVVEVVTGV